MVFLSVLEAGSGSVYLSCRSVGLSVKEQRKEGRSNDATNQTGRVMPEQTLACRSRLSGFA